MKVNSPGLFLCLLLALLFGGMPGAFAQTSRRTVPHKPGIDLFVYRRAHTTDEPVMLRISGYNQKRIDFTAFRISLPALVPTSRALEGFGKRLAAANLTGLPIAKSWAYDMGKIYPDQWTEREIKAPALPPGVYLIRARGAGAEKRTWLSVSDIALLSKRSRQELLLFAVSAHSGQPKPGLPITITDAQGKREQVATDAQGVVRIAQGAGERSGSSNLWLYGEQKGHPVFLLSGAPAPPDPFAIYMFTDRPIYRPGHLIQFKGVARQRLESDAPGGFVYRPYTDHEITIEIRDATDALVQRRTLKTNGQGSFDGSFQLASEPTLGRWQLIAIAGTQRIYSSMEVQAYRKPEFTVGVLAAVPHLVGGAMLPVTVEAHYFFGQPVAGASVQYQIQFQPQAGGPVPSGAAPEPAYNGQGVLDAQGRLRLEIKTQRLPITRRVMVHATVTDLSRRSQEASGDALITAGRFHLSLTPEKALYRAGETVRIQVQAEDYDDKPVAVKVRVRLIETREDSQHRVYHERTERDITTDAAGKGTAQFTPPRPGYLEMEAEAFDTDDNKIAAAGNLWIAGDDVEGYDYPNLDVIPDRAAYRPGAVASVLVNTSLVDPKPASVKPRTGKTVRNPNTKAVKRSAIAWALVVLQGERLYTHQVVRLTGRSTLLRIPLDARYFPSVRLSVVIVQERQVYEQDVPLVIERDQSRLKVTVEAEHDKVSPGQETGVTITTRDYLGRPVPAEVGVSVVDAAIYALQSDNAPDLFGFYYGGQEVRVQTDFSFAAQYSGGAAQTVSKPNTPPAPGAPPESGAAIRVRRQFADTALWRPFVMTDANGRGTVRFTLPDNLTTWRTTARAVTENTAVGTATHDMVSTLPLLVRLSLPRFYIEGDQAVVSAIVHNYTPDTRTVHARLKATGATIEGDQKRDLVLPPGGEQRLDWRAKVGNGLAGAAPGVYPPAVRFLVEADGGTGASDAAELTLPVAQDGVAQVESRAETMSDANGEFRVDLTKLPSDATLTLSLSPSIAAATFEALDYLTSYPYGCAEQTMSAFLPDVIVARALKKLNTGRKVKPDLEKWVNLGLQKLYRYQHADGGWNWWEFDQTDGDMTSYVLWGLLQARDAGYLVDEQRILRGTEVLIRMMRQEREWNRRADWILTLVYARPESVMKAEPNETAPPLEALFRNRAKLDTHSLASLCLALVKAGGPFAAEAAVAERELEAKAAVQGTSAHWPAADGGYTWRSDDAGVTAHVLRALLAAAPQSRLIPLAVRWLMANRVGKAWQSTRSSAEAVYALAEVMAGTGELQPNFTVTVLLDDAGQHEYAWTPAKAFDDPQRIVITPEQWHGRRTLTVRKRGPGVLYAAVQTGYTLPSAGASAASHGIAVRRTYQVTAEDPSAASTIASGTDVEVTVEVTADADYRYAILEEPIPAGCEVAPGDAQYRPLGLYFEQGGSYVRQEVRDNRVVFFFDELPKGRATFTYRLHAETPGVYRILPSLASLVYFPEVRGNSAPVKAQIGERPAQ